MARLIRTAIPHHAPHQRCPAPASRAACERPPSLHATRSRVDVETHWCAQNSDTCALLCRSRHAYVVVSTNIEKLHCSNRRPTRDRARRGIHLGEAQRARTTLLSSTGDESHQACKVCACPTGPLLPCVLLSFKTCFWYCCRVCCCPSVPMGCYDNQLEGVRQCCMCSHHYPSHHAMRCLPSKGTVPSP